MTAPRDTARSVRFTGATRTAALLGAVASAVAGAIQAVRPNDTDALVNGAEHVLLALVAAALVAWMPGYLALGATSRAGRAGAFAAVGGTGLLAFAMTASNLHGEDYAWFPALAVPANALWAVGSVILAVTTWRARSLPRALAAALPLIWLSTIVLSQLGGDLLAGALWAAVAWLAQTAAQGGGQDGGQGAPAAGVPAAGDASARPR